MYWNGARPGERVSAAQAIPAAQLTGDSRL
jgi:hypothetical protein